MKKIYLFMTLLLLSFILISYSGKQEENYYYKVLVIEENDTLWSIAKENYPNSNFNNKVKEIKTFNNLDGDKIIRGQKIVILLTNH